MSLVLELIDSGERRIVQEARAFTLGSFPGATWSLPQSPGAVPAGEVRILPDGASATVTLLRGAASLDQRALADDPRPLPSDAVLQIGSHRVRAQYRTDLITSHATEAPTISAILADVTPGGITAASPVPARSEDDWIAELTGDGPGTRPDWDNLGRYTGRDTAQAAEPNPLDTLPSGNAFLPDDWDDAGTDTQNRMAQSVLPGHVMAARDSVTSEAAPNSIAPDALTLAFLKGAEILPEEVTPLGPAQMQALGALLLQALDGIAALEAARARRAADLGLPRPPLTRDAFATLFAALQSGPDAARDLAARLADLALDGDAVLRGAQAFAADARDALDPAVIEAAAADGGVMTRLAGGRSRAAWATYRARVTGQGGTEDGGDPPPPLSEAALLSAIAARYGKTSTEAIDDTDESGGTG
ncbi:hypothetical protein [Jannaschia sp. CCS1]|uniref:hypothetical protein n=1 Tax=Jannaschia sp. (strain CCS1) TaxID=290400 RepID=UPI000053BDB7|nr:hypothetical protein [Jannaschia sp. CCS1]ABD55949.1 FHA domain containing protein [Jannaschia sp. CCS1]